MRAWNVTVSVGIDGDARDLAGRGVDARGQVDGDDGQPAGVDPLDQRGRLRARRPVEPGAEQGVDHDVAPFDGVGLDRLPARLAKHSRRDPAVATVRAAAADDREPARVGIHAHRLVRDRCAGPLHQLGRRGREARGTPPRRRASRPPCRAARSPRRSRAHHSSRTTQAAPAIVCECVSETSISRMPTRSANPRCGRSASRPASAARRSRCPSR